MRLTWGWKLESTDEAEATTWMCINMGTAAEGKRSTTDASYGKRWGQVDGKVAKRERQQ